MNLNPEQCDRFYRLWFLLLQHVNEREQLIPPLPENLQRGGIDPEDARILRDALWASDDNLDSFLAAQQGRLSEADLALVAGWQDRVSGKFYMMRHLKKHSIFLNQGEPSYAYGVLGIVSPLSEVINWPLPVLVEATLIPFDDKIIYDSLLVPYSVRFGSGIRKGLDNAYRNAQERSGIITSLGGRNESGQNDAIAIAAGNRKIINAFRKELAAVRLSSKMIMQHSNTLEAFADYLEKGLRPRSLLNINNNDIEMYWAIPSAQTNAVSFKRFITFMLNTDRMDWDTAENIKGFLKRQ